MRCAGQRIPHAAGRNALNRPEMPHQADNLANWCANREMCSKNRFTRRDLSTG